LTEYMRRSLPEVPFALLRFNLSGAHRKSCKSAQRRAIWNKLMPSPERYLPAQRLTPFKLKERLR
jgi:hypothetical protein